MSLRSSVTRIIRQGLILLHSRSLRGSVSHSPFLGIFHSAISPRFRIPLFICVSFVLCFDSIGLNVRQSHVDVRELQREEVHVNVAGRVFSHSERVANGKGVGKKPERYNLHTYELPWYTIELVGVQSVRLLTKIPKDVRDYWCADPSPPSCTAFLS